MSTPTEAFLSWQAGTTGLDDAGAGMTEHEYMVATSGHEYRTAPVTGTRSCMLCGLVPLDDEDMETACGLDE
jgi:hypothetical protein